MLDLYTKTKDKLQKTKKVRRAWSLYKWADRLWNWHDWYTWLYSFLQTKAGVAAAMATTAAVTTTAAVVTHNVVEQPAAEPYAQVETVPLPPTPAPPKVVVKEEPPPPPPPPPPPKIERQTESTVIFAIEGRDAAGRKGTFDVVVAKKEFLWVRKSADQIEKAGQVVPNEALASEIFDDEVRRGLERALGIIAVGTASQEGNATVETERAQLRARRTAEIVTPVIDPSTPIWTLNLGQFRGECAGCETGGTNWQRPFMLIAIKDLEAGTTLSEALSDAMTGKGRLPSPQSYSTFSLEKVR